MQAFEEVKNIEKEEIVRHTFVMAVLSFRSRLRQKLIGLVHCVADADEC